MEILKDIKGYEGLYQASSNGEIITLINRYDGVKYLKQATAKTGYKSVTLCKHKKHTTKLVHRLIAEAFYGQSDKEVNHKDGNKQNNQIENLEFVTKSENIKHALQNGLFKPNYKKIAIDKRKKVAQINKESNEIIAVFESAHDAARKTGFNRGNISTCCREQKIMYGYKWRYQ